MEPETGGTQQPETKRAMEHLSAAHSLLAELKNELDQHPKLEDAILRLEMALNILSAKTGGLL
jgi:predicted translin family RNA/ssDNA-binding protein